MTEDKRNECLKDAVGDVLPGLQERGLGSTNVWSEMYEESTPKIVQPKDVSDILGIADHLLERVNDLINQENSVLARLRDDVLVDIQEQAKAIAVKTVDQAISNKISDLFVPLVTNMSANWSSHKASVQKDFDDFRGNFNGRITNQVNTGCETALKPYFDKFDELKTQHETAVKTAEGKNAALDQLLEKVKNQQSTLSSEIDKVRKDHSNFVIQNSTESKDLRTTVQEHSKTLTTLDDKINDINKKIAAQAKGVATVSTEILDYIKPNLHRVSARSKENRQALERLLRPDGALALRPGEHFAFADALKTTADQVFTDPKFLRDSQICIDILNPEEAAKRKAEEEAEKAKEAEKPGKAKKSKEAS
ncbi:hypothetical protein Slin15195_G015230 [Septoria linicola]|uniref:Uncharacterized protein n=1 Tax=Septoria linicola TaxID=215465 RepID=A0A9Q9AI64_9PEZI|nr:hypothetical protein Slin15195_G015230 [Septoria linicola]